VIREKDSTFTVYLISQRADEGGTAPPPGGSRSLVVGRDFIARVAASGRQVLTLEKLHGVASSLSLDPRAAGAPLLHEHDTGDLPSPTDVALVLRYPALAPLLVLTGRFMFRLDKEGGVTWLGANPAPPPRPAATPAAPAAGGRP